MSLFRRAAVLAVVPATVGLAVGPASAHECYNASKKDQSSGVQIIFDGSFNPIWMTKGLENRVEQGLVDLSTGEGFHGLIGVDFEQDGTVDFSTWIVGPDDEIPLPAQLNGAPCHGVVNVEEFFANCVGG